MPREIAPSDPYLEKIKKLIPAEVSAAYLAINTMIPSEDSAFMWVLIFSGILMILCWLYLAKFQNVTGVYQLGFTTFVAFPIWAVNISIDRFEIDRYVVSAALVIVTLFAPLVMPKEE
jgi:hypothetical protein